ncbi:hypothetical protein EXIGLDRAFT_733475, partial [Exidia glandulosa HHB12029]
TEPTAFDGGVCTGAMRSSIDSYCFHRDGRSECWTSPSDPRPVCDDTFVKYSHQFVPFYTDSDVLHCLSTRNAESSGSRYLCARTSHPRQWNMTFLRILWQGYRGPLDSHSDPDQTHKRASRPSPDLIEMFVASDPVVAAALSHFSALRLTVTGRRCTTTISRWRVKDLRRGGDISLKLSISTLASLSFISVSPIEPDFRHISLVDSWAEHSSISSSTKPACQL